MDRQCWFSIRDIIYNKQMRSLLNNGLYMVIYLGQEALYYPQHLTRDLNELSQTNKNYLYTKEREVGSLIDSAISLCITLLFDIDYTSIDFNQIVGL